MTTYTALARLNDGGRYEANFRSLRAARNWIAAIREHVTVEMPRRGASTRLAIVSEHIYVRDRFGAVSQIGA